jgi:two-component system, OmpR family, response regulator CpxR
MNVLIIDDDIELCELLISYLSDEGFCVQSMHAFDSEQWRKSKNNVEMVILDVGLPRINGFEVLKKIRQESKLPILMLTARGDDMDRILGLELGADDYLPKPFNPRELVARIRAILRRSGADKDTDYLPIQVNDVVLDRSALSVTVAERSLILTSAEFSILERLMQDAGRVVSKQVLSQYALGRRALPADRSIDMHLSNLRKKVGEHYLRTIRNHGYQFVK